MQQLDSFNSADIAWRASRVPLTETQRNDYEHLMSWAEALRTEGKRDEARRITLVAAKIVQGGAPAQD